jgi:hypothetical protein
MVIKCITHQHLPSIYPSNQTPKGANLLGANGRGKTFAYPKDPNSALVHVSSSLQADRFSRSEKDEEQLKRSLCSAEGRTQPSCCHSCTTVILCLQLCILAQVEELANMRTCIFSFCNWVKRTTIMNDPYPNCLSMYCTTAMHHAHVRLLGSYLLSVSSCTPEGFSCWWLINSGIRMPTWKPFQDKGGRYRIEQIDRQGYGKWISDSAVNLQFEEISQQFGCRSLASHLHKCR